MRAALPAVSPVASGIYLRLSVTSACDLRCAYCRPGSARIEHAEGAPGPAGNDELIVLVGEVTRVRPVRKIRLTGGEPLLRRGIVDLVRELRRLAPRATIAMTTNGQRLAPLARRLRAAGLDALNVSLDTLDAGRFRRLSPTGALEATLAGIDAAVEAGFDALKINTVLLRSINGDHLDRLVVHAAGRGAEIRFIELMPIGAGAPLYPREFLSAADALTRLRERLAYDRPLGARGTAVRHAMRAGGRRVVVGFISPVSHPFCDGCDRLRIDARGRLVACLRGEDGIDLLGPLRRGEMATIASALEAACAGKGRAATEWPARTMYGIGG